MRCQANPPSLPGPTSRRVMGAHRGTDQTRGLPGDGVLLRRRVSTPPIPPRHPPAPRLKRPDPTVRRHPCPGSSGVEQWIENPRVGGSIPPPGTKAPLKVNDINGLWGKIVPPFSRLGKSGTFLFAVRSRSSFRPRDALRRDRDGRICAGTPPSIVGRGCEAYVARTI